MTEMSDGRRIPADSFRIRLAIVRTEMGWNYDQAEAATGIGSESWRLWEKGLRHCSDVIGVSRKIAEATPYDQSWLALGGALSIEDPQPRSRVRAAKAGKVTRISAVRTQPNRGLVTTQRRYVVRANAVACPSMAA